MLKGIYHTVVLLAALVVLGSAGFCAYHNWDKIQATCCEVKCCNAEGCDCGADCKCTADNKCSEECKCNMSGDNTPNKK